MEFFLVKVSENTRLDYKNEDIECCRWICWDFKKIAIYIIKQRILYIDKMSFKKSIICYNVSNV